MSDPLTSEEEARYTQIIDAILATADLETITRKKILNGLKTALGGKDLDAQKLAIKYLIEARFNAIHPDSPPASSAPAAPESKSPIDSDAQSAPKRKANGYHQDSDVDADADEDGDEIAVSPQPVKKKQRKEGSEDADAKLAAKLQAQEDKMIGRATRGGGGKAKANTKKKLSTARKKSAKKVRADDDSDMEGSESGNRPAKAGGGFQKPFNLSFPLAEVCGESQLSRPQVVKRLWQHIKGNELQDPKDKRQILCDEKLQAIFKQNKVDMFQMNKLIGNHLYPVEEE